MEHHAEQFALRAHTRRSAILASIARARPTHRWRRDFALRRSRSARLSPGELALEEVPRDARDLTGSGNIEITHDAIGRRANGRKQFIERLALVPKIRKPPTTFENLNLAIEHIDRLRNLALQAFRALAGDE